MAPDLECLEDVVVVLLEVDNDSKNSTENAEAAALDGASSPSSWHVLMGGPRRSDCQRSQGR